MQKEYLILKEKIEENVFNALINFNIIDRLFNIVDNDLILKENFKNNINYIYADYFCYKNDFDIENFNEILVMIKKCENYNIRLEVNNYSENQIKVYIEYDKHQTIPFDYDTLSEKNKEEFNEKLFNQRESIDFEISNFKDCKILEHHIFHIYVNNYSMNINQEIDNQLTNIIKQHELTMSIFRQENKSYFKNL